MKRIRTMLVTLMSAILIIFGTIGLAPRALAYSSGQASDARPGIAYAGGVLYVGWSGLDSGHTLNIGALNFDSGGAFQGWASVNTFVGTSVYPHTGPSVTAAQVPGYPGDQIIVAWADTSGLIHVGHYIGTQTLSCTGSLGGDITHHSPYLIGIGSTVYLAWTGTDQHIYIEPLPVNVCSASVLPPSVKLADTASAGPALTTDGSNIYVAWAGTGSGENLWAGQFTGATTLAHHTCFCSYKSADDVGLTLSYTQPNGGGVLTYHGTNNRLYILSVTLNTNGISSNGQNDGGATNFGADATAVPSTPGIHVPSGLYDSFVAQSTGPLTFNLVGN